MDDFSSAGNLWCMSTSFGKGKHHKMSSWNHPLFRSGHRAHHKPLVVKITVKEKEVSSKDHWMPGCTEVTNS